MIHRLRAQEALQATTIAAIGGGHLPAATAKQTTAQWERQASGGHDARAPKATPETLAGMGIAVVKRKKKIADG